MLGMSDWIVGVDFGRQNDRTAVAAIEMVPAASLDDGSRSRTWLDLRHLERFPVGMPYPDQCSRLAALLEGTSAFEGRARLVVDATGVGVAVADELRTVLTRAFVELTITGGSHVQEDGRRMSVPKRDLVSRLAVTMQQRRIRIPRGLPEYATLYDELQAFSVTITDAGTDVYGARKGHDDLVLAVSYAVWLAERTSSFELAMALVRSQLRTREEREAAAARRRGVELSETELLRREMRRGPGSVLE
jgi:hypothetical protein